MSVGKVKFYVKDLIDVEFGELEKDLYDFLERKGHKLSGPIYLDEVIDRRQNPTGVYIGEDRRQTTSVRKVK